MPLSLRVLLVFATAFVCGVALWGDNAAHAASTDAERAAAAAAASAIAAAADLPALVEGDLVRAVLAMAPAQRADLVVDEFVTTAVLFARAAPPAAISHGGGVALAQLDQDLAKLVQQSFAQAATYAASRRSRADEVPPELPGSALFAIAGDLHGKGDFYLRWHTATFVCEWVRLGDGAVFARWRDFVADAAQPWLRDELGAGLRR